MSAISVVTDNREWIVKEKSVRPNYPEALAPRTLNGIDDPVLERRAMIFWLAFGFPCLFAAMVAFAIMMHSALFCSWPQSDVRTESFSAVAR